MCVCVCVCPELSTCLLLRMEDKCTAYCVDVVYTTYYFLKQYMKLVHKVGFINTTFFLNNK